MDALELYVHDEGAGYATVQLAIVHAEFEAIHPFLGRQRTDGPA